LILVKLPRYNFNDSNGTNHVLFILGCSAGVWLWYHQEWSRERSRELSANAEVLSTGGVLITLISVIFGANMILSPSLWKFSGALGSFVTG